LVLSPLISIHLFPDLNATESADEVAFILALLPVIEVVLALVPVILKVLKLFGKTYLWL
jgi:hypothetical protein